MNISTRWPDWLLAMALLCLVLHAPIVQADACPDDPTDDVVPQDMLIVFAPGVPDEAAAMDSLLGEHPELSHFDPPRHIPQLRAWLVHAAVATEREFEALEDLVSARPEVSEADDHWLFDTPEGVQRALPDLTRSPTPDDYWFQPAADAIRAEPSGRRWTGAGVTVAVIDTSSALSNPITAASMVGKGVDLVDGGETADVPANGTDDDGDGSADESDQHGTFAAGLVHLAAPGARILHVRVLDDDGRGDAWNVALGIVEAVERGARVLNLSFGVTNELEILEVAVEWAVEERGVVVVAAAGNEAIDCVARPAADDEGGVVAVAAVADDLQPAPFSSFGEDVAISAPGVDVISTHGDELGHWSGTSFATPLVAGGAAILLEKYPTMTPEEVRQALMDSAQPFSDPQPTPETFGVGVLDLGALHDLELESRDSFRLRQSGADVLASWSPVAGATTYDLVRGEVRNLVRGPSGSELGPLACIRDDLVGASSGLSLGDADPVPPGGFFYLVADDGARPEDRFGHDSAGKSRVAGPTDCLP